MAEVFRVVQPITHEKLVGRIESDKLRLVLQLGRNMLMQQGANFERAGRSLTEERHETVKGSSRVDDILDQKNVLAFESSLGIVKQSNCSARFHRVTVARCNQEIDLKRTPYVTHQIAKKDEASLQQSKDEQLAVRICFSYLFAHLRNAPGDGVFIVSDALECPSGKSRVCCG